jgi:tetratricopeptide (TPR) repeat protein
VAQAIHCGNPAGFFMHAVRLILGLVLLLGWLTASAAAKPDELVDDFVGNLSELEDVLFSDAADGRLERFDPLDIALIASGVEDRETLARYKQAAEKLVAELKRSAPLSGSTRQQAEAIFDFMHGRVLRDGYGIEATDLRVAVDRGRFNCVSASVLFNYLASQCGLAACGLETPGHAMSRVYLDNGTLDIETTCPRWFRLSHDPERQAEHVEKTLGQSPLDRGPLREVTAIEMAAMIYYNRGVDLLADKKFSPAAAANAKALRLDPTSKTARGNLLATINNWAIVEGTLQRYEEAVGLLRRGLAIEPTYEMFELNFVHVCHQWSLSLCLEGRYDDAVSLLVAAADERPNRPYLRQAVGDVYRRWARARFDARDLPGALACLDAARGQLGATPEWLDAEAAEICQWAESYSARNRWEAAVEVFDHGLARLPQAELLRDGRRAASARLDAELRRAMLDPSSLPAWER